MGTAFTNVRFPPIADVRFACILPLMILKFLAALALQTATMTASVDEVGDPVTNPCTSEVGQVGFDQHWVNAVLIAEGFPKEFVCEEPPTSNAVRERQRIALSERGPDVVARHRETTDRRVELITEFLGRSEVRLGIPIQIYEAEGGWTPRLEREAEVRTIAFRERARVARERAERAAM
ncbi:hypothetical protein [Brevundimonas sp. FT23042]|uniref:hypothetical protein n=1 Tax=Brevundimonas sp. FT23042 TaxID=3393749 RepID=UPI003B587CE4